MNGNGKTVTRQGLRNLDLIGPKPRRTLTTYERRNLDLLCPHRWRCVDGKVDKCIDCGTTATCIHDDWRRVPWYLEG